MRPIKKRRPRLRLLASGRVFLFFGIPVTSPNQVDKAFLLHDKDGDGKLNKTEMGNMIARGKKAKAEKDARERREQSGKQRSAKKS